MFNVSLSSNQFFFSFTTQFSPAHPSTRPPFKHGGIVTKAAPFMIMLPFTVCSEKQHSCHEQYWLTAYFTL